MSFDVEALRKHASGKEDGTVVEVPVALIVRVCRDYEHVLSTRKQWENNAKRWQDLYNDCIQAILNEPVDGVRNG